MKNFILIALLALLPIPSHAFDSEESDKQRHIVLSALIVRSAYAVTEDMTTSVLIAFGVGMAKELYDSSKRGGRVDPQDLGANAVGIGIGFLWVGQF